MQFELGAVHRNALPARLVGIEDAPPPSFAARAHETRAADASSVRLVEQATSVRDDRIGCITADDFHWDLLKQCEIR